MAASEAIAGERRSQRDIGFAAGIVAILAILFLPVPAILLDIGLAFSIALSVLILMVALWIKKPLEFSAFPTVLLIATLLRLALGIATTRLILANGQHGVSAAGHVIQGFSQFVMSGDFVIGIVVFLILITVNFLVITKGATRIAEVGARFTLDAIPGKQMAIDADLNAGLIDDKEAQSRRRELEEESAFFGSMDGASKFVRGEAIASLITIAVNVFGGIIIGTTRHGMPLGQAAEVFTKLSVGDGLVSQIPALIVSLAAGLLVSKGGTRGTAEQAVMGQLGAYPRALSVAAALMFMFALVPGLPFVPFMVLSGLMAFTAYAIPKKIAAQKAIVDAKAVADEEKKQVAVRESVKESLKTPEIELCLGRQVSAQLQGTQSELSHRVAKMRRKFARQYGFVVPDIKLTDSLAVPPKCYQILIHGTVVATQELRPGELLVVVGDGPVPDVPSDEVREPAFGMKARWVLDAYAGEVRRGGFEPIDGSSVLLTHLSEVIRNNLPTLLSYKDMRNLLDRLDPEYKRLLDEICPSQISYSGLQAVLKLLLSERVSIRNLHLILEAVAEITPHARRAEQIAEHVRMRIAQQICGDLAENGVLAVLRLGSAWDLSFHQSLKRDGKGEVIEFDIDPRLVEQFGTEASEAIRKQMRETRSFALVTAPDARPYVRMIIERLYPTLAVLSHLEIARGVEIRSLGDDLVTALVASGLLGPESFLGVFLIFCRVGACLLIVPGFSSPRVPAQVRLLISLAVSLALSPLLLPLFQGKLSAQDPGATLAWIVTESLTGLVLGFLGRIFYVVLETVVNAAVTMVGFGGMPGSVAEGMDPVPAVEAMIMMAAAALLFAADLHWELFRGLIDSYSRIPPGEGIGSQAALVRIVDQVTTAFVLGLRITSPFLIYAVAVNLAAGFINKLVPQIPVYFIATPFIMAGGLLLLYAITNEFMMQFVMGYFDYLRRG